MGKTEKQREVVYLWLETEMDLPKKKTEGQVRWLRSYEHLLHKHVSLSSDLQHPNKKTGGISNPNSGVWWILDSFQYFGCFIRIHLTDSGYRIYLVDFRYRIHLTDSGYKIHLTDFRYRIHLIDFWVQNLPYRFWYRIHLTDFGTEFTTQILGTELTSQILGILGTFIRTLSMPFYLTQMSSTNLQEFEGSSRLSPFLEQWLVTSHAVENSEGQSSEWSNQDHLGTSLWTVFSLSALRLSLTVSLWLDICFAALSQTSWLKQSSLFVGRLQHVIRLYHRVWIYW